MADRYQNKDRLTTTRLPQWDYGWNAAYFVTICTKDRHFYFGDVVDGKMQLSEIRKMAHTCWMEIPQHFPFVKLGNHVIMLDHVHGIVIIDKPDNEPDLGILKTSVAAQNLALQPDVALPQQKPKNKFGPQSGNLASIIRDFKAGVTKNARQINPDFSWQSRYYDHIIRNGGAYDRISRYIADNPLRWEGKQFREE